MVVGLGEVDLMAAGLGLADPVAAGSGVEAGGGVARGGGSTASPEIRTERVREKGETERWGRERG